MPTFACSFIPAARPRASAQLSSTCRPPFARRDDREDQPASEHQASSPFVVEGCGELALLGLDLALKLAALRGGFHAVAQASACGSSGAVASHRRISVLSGVWVPSEPESPSTDAPALGKDTCSDRPRMRVRLAVLD